MSLKLTIKVVAFFLGHLYRSVAFTKQPDTALNCYEFVTKYIKWEHYIAPRLG